MNLKALLNTLPETVRYIAVLGIVMLILYVCLTLTRILGQNIGKKVTYDNPEEYEKTIPDLFASTAFKRRQKNKENKEEKKDQ